MPLISEPWAVPDSDPSRLVALSAHLNSGVAQSLARACFWLGPFTMGAVTWETFSTLPSNFTALINVATDSNRRLSRRTFDAAMRLSTLISQAACLAALAIYNAWTHGDPEIGCGSWPRAFVGMSALAVSFAVSVFLLQVLKMARLPIPVICLIGFLDVAQLVLTLASIDAWHGGLRPSGAACYIRISRWFGVFSLFPLVALFMAISTLTVGISQERIRISSSRRLQRPKNLPFTPPVDERPAEKTASESHLDRLYRAAGVEPPNADDAEQVDAIGRSFLKLSNSDAGSIVSADRHSERSFEALRRFNAWAIPTAVTLLCGCIIAFMDLSPILPLVYQPILIVIPTLCANRLCSMRITSSDSRRSTACNSGSSGSMSRDGLGSTLIDHKATRRAGRFQPLQLRLGHSNATSSHTSTIDNLGSNDVAIGGIRKVGTARFLMHHASGQSLRAHFMNDGRQRQRQQQQELQRHGSLRHNPAGSVENFVQRSGAISGPMLGPSSSMRMAIPPATNIPDGFFRVSTAASSGGRTEETPSPTTMMRIRTDDAYGDHDPWKKALLQPPQGAAFRSYDNLRSMQRLQDAGVAVGPGGVTSLAPVPRRKKASLTSKTRGTSSRPGSDSKKQDASTLSTAAAADAAEGSIAHSSQRDSILSSKQSCPSSGGKEGAGDHPALTARDEAFRTISTQPPSLAAAGTSMADRLAPTTTDSNSMLRSSDRSANDSQLQPRNSDARHSSQELDPDPHLLREDSGEGGEGTYRFSGPGRPLSMAFEPSAPRDGSIELNSSEGGGQISDRGSLQSMGKHTHGGSGPAAGPDSVPLQPSLSSSSGTGGARKPRVLVPAPKTATTPSAKSVSLADLDDDELKQVLDARGFAIDDAGGITRAKRLSNGSIASSRMSREEAFALALAQRKSEADEEKRARKAMTSGQRQQQLQAPAPASQAAETESSFGLRDIAGNPRLRQQQEELQEDGEVEAIRQEGEAQQQGKKQRKEKQRADTQPHSDRNPRKPFFRNILPMGMPERTNSSTSAAGLVGGLRKRPSQLSEEERKPSDGSNRSDPTAITSSSGGNSSGQQSSNSGSGGAGNSSVSGDAPSGRMVLVGRRVGVGERGALPEGSRILSRITSGQVHPQPFEQGAVKTKTSFGARSQHQQQPQAPPVARSLRSKASGSEGGQSAKSRDTFGGSFGAGSVAGSG